MVCSPRRRPQPQPRAVSGGASADVFIRAVQNASGGAGAAEAGNDDNSGYRLEFDEAGDGSSSLAFSSAIPAAQRR